MYVTISGTNYPARAPRQSHPVGMWWHIALIDEPELEIPVSGEIGVYGDDGFELCKVNTEDYDRQTYADGIFTLTNQPAPEPDPEPTEEEKAAYEAQALFDAKIARVQESKYALAQFLEENPLTWIDGQQYNVTEEKQSLLTSQLALQSIAEQAGVERELKWNTTGGVCTNWTMEALSALALAIGEYVQPLVTYQQQTEVAINAAQTMEELEAIEIDYASALPQPEPEPDEEQTEEPETPEETEA